jgi:hypothetical protein
MNECFIEDNDIIGVQEWRDSSCPLAGAAVCEERWKAPDIPELEFYISNSYQIRLRSVVTRILTVTIAIDHVAL